MNYLSNERKLIYLPAKLDGLTIPIFSEIGNTEHEFENKLIILQHCQNDLNTMRSNLPEPRQRLNSLNQKQRTLSYLPPC